jgi:hypothetical protein
MCYSLLPPWGLPPYRVEKICVSQWSEELCWREIKLLIGPPMPARSEGLDRMKLSTWYSNLGVGRFLTPLPRVKILLLRNLQSLLQSILEEAEVHTRPSRQHRTRVTRVYRSLFQLLQISYRKKSKDSPGGDWIFHLVGNGPLNITDMQS